MRISPQAKDVPELAEYLMDVPKAIDDELKKDRHGPAGRNAGFWYLSLLRDVSVCHEQRYLRIPDCSG